MQTTVLLEPLCTACDKKSLFVARIYSQAIDSHVPFTVLPKYKGTCVLYIMGTNVHVSALNVCDGEFLAENYLDLCLRILEAAPEIVTASWERHKGEELKRSIDIVSTIRVLTRRVKKPATL